MSAGVISLIAIIVCLGLLMYLAFRGYSILIVSPVMAAIVAMMSGQDIMRLLTGPFMTGFANFAKSNFMIFLLSAVFGKFMGDSGAARSIAYTVSGIVKRFPKHQVFLAVLSLPLINAILTYGGISLFVVTFTLIAIARSLFKDLDIPWHLYMCASLGSGTFTMTMLPGTPAIQNLIPMKYFGTTPTAAPVLGLACAVVQIALGVLYIRWVVNRARANGEHFLPTGASIDEAAIKEDKDAKTHPIWKCLLPPVVLLIVMNGLMQSPVVALVCAIASCYLLFFPEYKDARRTLNEGASNSIMPITNVCAAVGFGSVVGAVPGFEFLTAALSKLPGPPIVQLVVAVNVAAGVTGSASGGLGIALEALGKRFMDMGINREVAHRLAAISSGGLDSLPHNGAVISGLSVARLTHRQAYRHQFFLTVVIPVAVAIFGILLSQVGIK